MLFRFCFAISVTALLGSCTFERPAFDVSEMDMLANVKQINDSLTKLNIDLEEAVLKGICIPTHKQTSNGYLDFSFKLKNRTGSRQRFFYKIFYQNKTYKFSENHPYSHENFYGSWEDNKVIFRSTPYLENGEEILIRDSFKIVGNPRNERVFYGADPETSMPSLASINQAVHAIETSPDWLKQIEEKARQNYVSHRAQIYKDALWFINNERQKDSSSNNRWKRNPRMGIYEFKLLVTTPEDFEEIPAWIKDISQKNTQGVFANPFAWFKKIPAELTGTQAIYIKKELLVAANLDLSKGIYVNPLSLDNADYKTEDYSGICGDSANLYRNAQVELFFHNINRGYKLHNIPLVADVVGDNYTREQYLANHKRYANSPELVDTFVSSTNCPCKNVTVNKEERSIILRNPGNKPGEFKKEHVGIITRVGFTYGKFRAKIKFPETMSKDHVWNGITNAFWLMAQEVNLNWNMRRICNGEVGYIPKQEPDVEASLMKGRKQITYSEIDFEILKESRFWPKTSYNVSNTTYQTDDSFNNHDIMVTCTNWDMGCQEPEYFNIGAMEHVIDGAKFVHHRWNKWYKALTTKVPAPHDELFASPYYYYEIEWTPEKIIWRIGPEKDRMRTICVMDKNVTAIPNNQMLMIITQEWHNEEWWPTAPFKQNFIPFPKNDIVGKVLELEIE